jgi:hypothetical protein
MRDEEEECAEGQSICQQNEKEQHRS